MLEKASISLSKWMYWIAGAAIVLMMVITCADVVLRYFRRPIPGTYELVCFLGSVAVSFAMARTTFQQGHVAVSLVVRLLSQRSQIVVELITTCFSFLLFAVLSWQALLFAGDLHKAHEVSLTLELPYYPFVYGLSFAAASVCLVLLADLVHHMKKALKR